MLQTKVKTIKMYCILITLLHWHSALEVIYIDCVCTVEICAPNAPVQLSPTLCSMAPYWSLPLAVAGLFTAQEPTNATEQGASPTCTAGQVLQNVKCFLWKTFWVCASLM